MPDSLKKLRIFAASPSDVTNERAKLETVVDSLKPMGQVRQLDKRMNNAVPLRLMVSDALAMNMSNTLGYLRGELKDAGKNKPVSFGKRVLELGFVKKILLAVYNKIFKMYYE